MPMPSLLPIFSETEPTENDFRLEVGRTPSEPSVYREHQDALEATLFSSSGLGLDEIIFELESGEPRRFRDLN
ncbi:MAG: hypothetical protein CBC48_04870 [bacterium TMED88]|nr:hypothetical protein [Deltaproteobacteria bacterium]OUV35010.1 MAG: hypothetical protein CBC48_04870 [bacterium TMED88]